MQRSLFCLASIYTSNIQNDKPSFEIFTSIIETIIHLYSMSISKAIKVGLIESGALAGSGIEIDSAASLALENFTLISNIKDEVIRLFLPNSVKHKNSTLMITPPPVILRFLCNLISDEVRIKIIKLIKMIILMHSKRLTKSETPEELEHTFCLNQAPEISSIALKDVVKNSSAPCCTKEEDPAPALLKPKRLQDEAEKLLSNLISWTVQGKGGAYSTTDTSNKEIGPHLVPITIVNLKEAMSTLVDIACQRPQYFSKILQAFETLHVNLPPDFTEVDVTSIRKTLKDGLLHLLRHPSVTSEFQSRITILLTDLGAAQSEVVNAMQSRRKAVTASSNSTTSDVMSFDPEMDEEEEDEEEFNPETSANTKKFNKEDLNKLLENTKAAKLPESLPEVDRMISHLVDKLSPANVADLVLLSMVTLPQQMPANFLSTYTPIAAAGTTAQVNHLARLLATQLSVWGNDTLENIRSSQANNSDSQQINELRKHVIILLSLINHFPRQTKETSEKKSKRFLNKQKKFISSAEAAAIAEKNKLLETNEIPKIFSSNDGNKLDVQKNDMPNEMIESNQNAASGELSRQTIKRFTNECFFRILSAISSLDNTNYSTNPQDPLKSTSIIPSGSNFKHESIRFKLLTRIPCNVLGNSELYTIITDYCLTDLRRNYELLATLLVQEYQRARGYQLKPKESHNENIKCLSQQDPGVKNGLSNMEVYDTLFSSILMKLSTIENKKHYFTKMYLEAPLITRRSINFLKQFCWIKEQCSDGFYIIRVLVETRDLKYREEIFEILYEFCHVADFEIRSSALKEIKNLFESSNVWAEKITDYAEMRFKKILAYERIPEGDEERILLDAAQLFFGIIPLSPKRLLKTLADVYVESTKNIKKTILHNINDAVLDLGIHHPALHEFIDNCPSGSETIITRILYILTDFHSSSTEKSVTPPVMPPRGIVDKVRRLYSKRNPDIRCLIPVIVGLTKKEVIAALHKLVQLTEPVLKEVISRLLRASVGTLTIPVPENLAKDGIKAEYDSKTGPIEPEELLVALHLLEFRDVPDGKASDLKVILRACNFCLSERKYFSQERLSVAIGNLIEQPKLPTLLMRTVMQALALYPRLLGYVINVLARLLRKQIWQNTALWDGFIRCCIKTRPQCFQVLLQLSSELLESVFHKEPNLRSHVRRYVDNFSSAQRSHISRSIMHVLNNNLTNETKNPKGSVQQSTTTTISSEESVVKDQQQPTTIPEDNTNSISTNNENITDTAGPPTPTKDEPVSLNLKRRQAEEEDDDDVDDVTKEPEIKKQKSDEELDDDPQTPTQDE